MDTPNKRIMTDESLPIDVRRAAFRAHNRGETGDRTIRFSADLITPDDTDTDAYGEPCSPGFGYKITNGWWAPKFSKWQVSDDVAYADTFTYVDDVDGPGPVEWLVDIIGEYAGCVEVDSAPTFYGADFHQHRDNGLSVRPCAHAYGFTDAEINAAVAYLAR